MRERGIYRVPDGEEYVAIKGPDAMFFLFRLESWFKHGAVDLRVNANGTISRKGATTLWKVGDFEDTGRTAQEPPFRYLPAN
jgi:hypothetical protein